jgi:hypothetical protein
MSMSAAMPGQGTTAWAMALILSTFRLLRGAEADAWYRPSLFLVSRREASAFKGCAIIFSGLKEERQYAQLV